MEQTAEIKKELTAEELKQQLIQKEADEINKKIEQITEILGDDFYLDVVQQIQVRRKNK